MKLDINERFREFHEANPHVYTGLRELALEAKRRGRGRYSVEQLYCILRWHRSIRTRGAGTIVTQTGTAAPAEVELKLNDHYTSRYARMLMALNPELVGFFQTRRIHDAEVDWTLYYRADGTKLP